MIGVDWYMVWSSLRVYLILNVSSGCWSTHNDPWLSESRSSFSVFLTDMDFRSWLKAPPELSCSFWFTLFWYLLKQFLICTGSVACLNSEPHIWQKTVYTGSGLWWRADSLLYLSLLGSVPSVFLGILLIILETRPFGLTTCSSEGDAGSWNLSGCLIVCNSLSAESCVCLSVGSIPVVYPDIT